MAWEWSHTAEAYANARDQVFALPQSELDTIMHEWRVYDSLGGEDDYPYNAHTPTLEDFDAVPAPVNVDPETVAERMEDLRTCDNGGGRAWTCPYGCHTVPFDPVDPDTLED